MSLVATLYTRLVTPLGILLRATVNRLGVTPVIVAAVACAAAVYSWRNRPPNHQQRRRRRQRSDATNAHQSAIHGHNTDSASSPDSPHDSDFSIARTSNHVGSRANSISSSLRKPQWLSRVRRVTLGGVCSLAHPCNLFAIQTSDSEPTQPPSETPDLSSDGSAKPDQQSRVVSFLPDVIPQMKALASLFELFVVIRVDNDVMEQAVTKAFVDAGLFSVGLMDERKLVFCETDAGRVSVARQIESQLHVDESFEVVVALQRFLHCVALVCPDAGVIPVDMLGRNVAKHTSLSSLLS